MGNNTSSSFSATDIVNSCITSTIMTSSQSCSSNLSNAQDISISNLNLIGCELNISGLNQSQTIRNNFDCLQKSEMTSTIKTDFANKLDQALSATLSGLNLNINNQTDVTALVNIRNNIVNNTDMMSIANCVSTTLNSQKTSINGIRVTCTAAHPSVNISDINQTIIASSVANCTQQSAMLASAITSLDNFIKQKLDAANQGISTAMLMTGLIIFGVVALIILAIVLGFNPFAIIGKIFSGLFGDDETQPTQPTQVMSPAAKV